MPNSIADEKSARRAQKRMEFENRLPKSQQGSVPIRLSFEDFKEIFQKALDTIGATQVKYDPSHTSAKFQVAKAKSSDDLVILASLLNLYENKKFHSAENCLAATISSLRTTAEMAQSDKPEEPPPENLFLTVKTHEFILDTNAQIQRSVRTDVTEDRVMFRPFSASSGELYIALVLGMEDNGTYTDNWIPSWRLTQWNLTEDQAFQRALANIDSITPKKLSCLRVKTMADWQKALKTRRKELIHITQMDYFPPPSKGMLQVVFRDSRALPRLLLPRVIERLSEVLCCDPLSLVVVPFEDDEFQVANAEDRFSMLLLAIHQTLPFCQGDNPHVKHRVSWNPFKVTKLRNEKGLVELEPYLVNGGRSAVQLWIGDKQKVFYPMPRAKDDIAAVKDMVKNPRRDNAFTVLTESAFLEGHCWQCRKRFEKLQTCANCRKAKYCSRECQKGAWREGHNVNCEERRRFWEAVKMCRPSKASKAK